jgi:hypothetical protein
MGGFSYTEVLSVFMERTLALLEVGGSFFTVALDVHSESGNNAPHYKGSPYRTYIETAEGKEVKLCSWLKSIGCVQVSCEFKDNWHPPVELYRVHKTCDQVTVPALRSVEYTAGTPPQRGYRLVTAPATPTASTPAAGPTPATVVVQPRATATPVVETR